MGSARKKSSEFLGTLCQTLQNDTKTSEKELFDKVTQRLEDIVHTVRVRYVDKNTKDAVFFDSRMNQNKSRTISMFTEQRFRVFGKCYTFSPEATMVEVGIVHIWMVFYMDVRIYFHGKDNFFDLYGRLGLDVYVDDIVHMELAIQDVVLVPRPNVHASRVSTCSNEITYDQCVYSVLEKETRNATMAKCTVPWVFGNADICISPNDVNASLARYRDVLFKQSLTKTYCPQPCHSTKTTVGDKCIKDCCS